jgi:inner membrane protein
MDPVTHIASGILVGQAVRAKFPRGRWLLIFTALCAWIPDIDNFVTYLGPEAYMRYHRGLTHSILGGAVLAALLAAAFRPLSRGASFARVFGLAYGCILLHDFLDVITTYGTQILLPFSDARIGLPAVFIVDPIYTGVMLVAVAAGFFMKSRARTVALAALCWIFLYPATSLGLREIVAAAQVRRLAAEGMAQAVAHVTTDGLSPLFWKVVVDDGVNYRVRGASLFSPSGGPDIAVRKKADREELRRIGRDAPIAATYDWFAEFPAVSDASDPEAPAFPVPGGGLVSEAQAGQAEATASPRVLVFSDMRFLGTSPALPEARRDPGRPGFAMRVELDASGRPAKVFYARGGEAHLVFSASATP